jgi:hypothetical protein
MAKVDAQLATLEVAIAENLLVQRQVGADAVDHDLVEGIAHAHRWRCRGLAQADQFADQRVVVGGDAVAAVEVRVDTDAIAARRVETA